MLDALGFLLCFPRRDQRIYRSLWLKLDLPGIPPQPLARLRSLIAYEYEHAEGRWPEFAAFLTALAAASGFAKATIVANEVTQELERDVFRIQANVSITLRSPEAQLVGHTYGTDSVANGRRLTRRGRQVERGQRVRSTLSLKLDLPDATPAEAVLIKVLIARKEKLARGKWRAFWNNAVATFFGFPAFLGSSMATILPHEVTSEGSPNVFPTPTPMAVVVAAQLPKLQGIDSQVAHFAGVARLALQPFPPVQLPRLRSIDSQIAYFAGVTRVAPQPSWLAQLPRLRSIDSQVAYFARVAGVASQPHRLAVSSTNIKYLGDTPAQRACIPKDHGEDQAIEDTTNDHAVTAVDQVCSELIGQRGPSSVDLKLPGVSPQLSATIHERFNGACVSGHTDWPSLVEVLDENFKQYAISTTIIGREWPAPTSSSIPSFMACPYRFASTYRVRAAAAVDTATTAIDSAHKLQHAEVEEEDPCSSTNGDAASSLLPIRSLSIHLELQDTPPLRAATTRTLFYNAWATMDGDWAWFDRYLHRTFKDYSMVFTIVGEERPSTCEEALPTPPIQLESDIAQHDQFPARGSLAMTTVTHDRPRLQDAGVQAKCAAFGPCVARDIDDEERVASPVAAVDCDRDGFSSGVIDRISGVYDSPKLFDDPVVQAILVAFVARAYPNDDAKASKLRQFVVEVLVAAAIAIDEDTVFDLDDALKHSGYDVAAALHASQTLLLPPA